MFQPITYRLILEFFSVKHIKPNLCFSTLHLVKTYQFSILQSLFLLLLLNQCIQQTLNEMSALQIVFFFVVIRICNSSTFKDKCNSQLSVLLPQRQRITCFFQVFMKFRVRYNFDFSFLPYLLFRMHEFKAPHMQKNIV